MASRKSDTQRPIDFETAFKELEKRVQLLEKEDLPLKQALKTFEEGIALVRFCTQSLNAAEQRLQELTETASKEVVLKDLDMTKFLNNTGNQQP
jgi:exodeoxyribonuclease VII small subunit